MGTQQQDAWFQPRPGDGDRRTFMADWQPIGIVVQCGQTNLHLEAIGIRHNPCDRPRGHDGFHCYEAL